MDKKTTFGHWRRVAPYTDFKMRKFSRPFSVGGVTTPETLNELTIGQLIDLSGISDFDGMHTICQVILNLTPEQTDEALATEVVRFVGWVLGEVEKINKLFESASPKPTDEEVRAGINKLNFGLFGMIDYYALRMGITDHDEVLNVKWMRIYKCIDMDNKKALFQKRYQEEILNEYRRKNQGRR